MDELKFEGDEKERSLDFYLPLTMSFGISKIIDIHSNIQLEFGVVNIIKKSELGSSLRFSDQISGQQGFVQPTRFRLENSFYKSSLLNLSLGYEREIGEKQFITVRLGVLKLIKSKYYLNIIDLDRNLNYDFSAQDLSFKDGFSVPQMSVRYAYQLTDGDVRARLFGEFMGTNLASRMNFQSGTSSVGLQLDMF